MSKRTLALILVAVAAVVCVIVVYFLHKSLQPDADLADFLGMVLCSA